MLDKKEKEGVVMENEITSAQVVFPDKRTLDEVYAALTGLISGLQSRIAELESAAAESAEA